MAWPWWKRTRSRNSCSNLSMACLCASSFCAGRSTVTCVSAIGDRAMDSKSPTSSSQLARLPGSQPPSTTTKWRTLCHMSSSSEPEEESSSYGSLMSIARPPAPMRLRDSRRRLWRPPLARRS